MAAQKEKLPSNRNFGLVFFVFFLIIGLWPLLGTNEIRYWSIFFSIIFFLVVTPIGVIMRVIGKDILSLKYNKKNKSYWIEKNGPKSKMKNQF